jgi:hypothetical protein
VRLVAAIICALVLPAAAHAATPADQIKQGLQKAVAAGWISPGDASRYRGILTRTNTALPRLGGSRHANLQAVLSDVARRSSQYTAPRALTLFGMLDENVRYFGAQGPPAPQADVVGADEVVYRYFPGHGLQFHPLANFAALNSHLATGRTDSARTLADALRARAVPSGGASVWEYEFSFGGGRPPWISGMAQAVAAQSLARAGQRLEDTTLGDLARQAWAAIPGKLVMQLPVGQWVKLYSFSRMAVFNAQLQTAVSLRDYADLAGDTAAGTLAASLVTAVQKALPQVDTGYWTRYTIGGAEESRGYHDFVVTILARLKAQTKDTFWSDLATKFKAYTTQPPLLELGPPATAAAAGTKAALKSTFWLSKASSVTLAAAGQSRRLAMTNGWHTITWTVPKAKAGIYSVSVQASPIAGPRASLTLSPLVVLAKAPPALAELSLAASRGGAGGSGFVVGAAENAVLNADPSASAGQLGLATAAGLRAIRVLVPWVGQTAPDPSLVTAAQQAAAAGVRLYVEIYPTAPPADPAAFTAFLRQVAAAAPTVKDYVIGTQVNDPSFWSGTPAAYLALLAASYDALKSVDPSLQVIAGSLDSQLAPGSYVLSLGQAYRRSGRTTPVMDALAIQPTSVPQSEAPSAVHASGPTTIGDYARLVANLKRAFDTTGQPGATLPIVYDGYGVQTQVPPEKASLYANAETDAVPEATQGQFYAQALQLATCQPTVQALLFDHVVDDRDLAASQAGLYYPDGTRKTSFSAVQTAVAAAENGTLPACPGAKPKQPVPPTVTSAADGRSVQLACARDCVYVAALERAGAPVRSQAGAAASGAIVTVSVPAGAVAGDRLVVHVASKQNPGDEVVQQGLPLP